MIKEKLKSWRRQYSVDYGGWEGLDRPGIGWGRSVVPHRPPWMHTWPMWPSLGMSSSIVWSNIQNDRFSLSTWNRSPSDLSLVSFLQGLLGFKPISLGLFLELFEKENQKMIHLWCQLMGDCVEAEIALKNCLFACHSFIKMIAFCQSCLLFLCMPSSFSWKQFIFFLFFYEEAILCESVRDVLFWYSSGNCSVRA